MNAKTIIACTLVALITGGGSAYATQQITSSQIKDGTIRSADIRNGSVGVRDLSVAARRLAVLKRAEVQSAVEEVISDPQSGLTIRVRGEKGDPGVPGPAGPIGPQGVPAPTTAHTLSVTIPNDDLPHGGGVSCPAGKVIVGGGAVFESSDATNTVVMSSGPVTDPHGWGARVKNSGPSTQSLTITALCQ